MSNLKEDIPKIKSINNLIWALDRRFRRLFPVLNHQDAIGMFVFIFSIIGICFNGYLFYKGLIPWWLCLVMNAILASFLHELEHDLIHHLYFNGRAWVQNIMFSGIWLFRGNLINPWYRRELHLRHHRESGQTQDIEERLIGNGMKWGLWRLIISIDPLMTLTQVHRLKRDIPEFTYQRILSSTFPMTLIFNTLWWTFIANAIFGFLPAALSTALTVIAVANLAPNILRQFCLTVVSSNCHYYGNIDKADLMKQCQVLEPWFLAPLQIFCFNFGSTHILHHFVIDQPFYLRQLVAPWVHQRMRQYNIPFNDVASLAKANAYNDN